MYGLLPPVQEAVLVAVYIDHKVCRLAPLSLLHLDADGAAHLLRERLRRNDRAKSMAGNLPKQLTHSAVHRITGKNVGRCRHVRGAV